VDTTRGEWVEKELNVMIERRHDQRVKTEGERTDEELWKERGAFPSGSGPGQLPASFQGCPGGG
jgi:hypothetical protein